MGQLRKNGLPPSSVGDHRAPARKTGAGVKDELLARYVSGNRAGRCDVDDFSRDDIPLDLPLHEDARRRNVGADDRLGIDDEVARRLYDSGHRAAYHERLGELDSSAEFYVVLKNRVEIIFLKVENVRIFCFKHGEYCTSNGRVGQFARRGLWKEGGPKQFRRHAFFRALFVLQSRNDCKHFKYAEGFERQREPRRDCARSRMRVPARAGTEGQPAVVPRIRVHPVREDKQADVPHHDCRRLRSRHCRRPALRFGRIRNTDVAEDERAVRDSP